VQEEAKCIELVSKNVDWEVIGNQKAVWHLEHFKIEEKEIKRKRKEK
jgi:hypothetical protein